LDFIERIAGIMNSTDDAKVIAIIPARSGSKGLIKKNIQFLGDKPLMAWTIEAAVECDLVDRTVVTTDSLEFAEIARKFGASVPFLRPDELASDSARVEDALIHAVEWIEQHEGIEYDIVVLLQITDVFRNRSIVSDVVKALLDDPDLDSAFAVKPDFKNYWRKNNNDASRISDHRYVPRQVREPLYREDTGVALASRVEVIRRGDRIGRSVQLIEHENPGDFVDIHTELDLWLANQLISQRGVVPNRD
tara:strand:+ start:546 stop:1292 length:747 start_codon:yes stop_codon:yes gene_type:complete